MKTAQRYLITWEMDIYADSPRGAAEKAWDHMRHPFSTANVFTVVNKDGDKIIVDLLEGQQP